MHLNRSPEVAVPTELDLFLKASPSGFDYRVLKSAPYLQRIHLTSQVWQGELWEHPLFLAHPGTDLAKTAILEITGDQVDDRDEQIATRLAEISGLPVAVLSQIPNQPLWGLHEDALIAHTFDRFLETEDPSWPLLFPMVLSVHRAMDALEQEFGIKNFVITGASKRGWTTWLSACSLDPRVIGIAPRVFDFLNIPAQLEHQLASWGNYSPMLADYTQQELQERSDSELGQHLTKMVDPYSYLPHLRCPVFVLTGSNDPFWTIDALGLYWKDIPGIKWCWSLPNHAHDLGDSDALLNSLTTFACLCASQGTMPTFENELQVQQEGKKSCAVLDLPCDDRLRHASLWAASSQDRHFENSFWTAVARAPLELGTRALQWQIETTQNTAVMGQFAYLVDGLELTLSTPIQVVPKLLHNR